MGTHRSVLVVDDEMQMLHVLALRLREGGYQVHVAQDGLEALKLADTTEPSLVVCDYQVPGLSGLELCQRLRQSQRTRDIPALLMTAHGFWIDAAALKAAGVTRCLRKPFSPRELVRLADEMTSAVPLAS